MIPDSTKPIFVIGTGRSGSTIFFDMFAKHPEVAWPSELSRRFPRQVWLNRTWMRLRSWPGFDTLAGSHYGPSEAYPFWDSVCPGFSNPCRDLTAEDVTQVAESRARRAVSGITNQRRHRFLAKITGWPRTRYLNRIFPASLFIEVTRDPRATACSLLEVDFWDGWRGPPNWRRGELPPDLDRIWRDEKQSFVALAALECVIIQRAVSDCRLALSPDRYLAIRYSDLCADPFATFRTAVSFADLRWTSGFERALRNTRLDNRDDHWKAKLTASQQAILERTLERAQSVLQG